MPNSAVKIDNIETRSSPKVATRYLDRHLTQDHITLLITFT